MCEWTPPSESRPIRCSVRPPSVARWAASTRTGFAKELAILDRQVDPRDRLVDDEPRAEVEMPDLGVPHLTARQADIDPTRSQRRVRIGGPEPIEDGRVRQFDRIAGTGGLQPPAVQNHEHDRPRWMGYAHRLLFSFVASRVAGGDCLHRRLHLPFQTAQPALEGGNGYRIACQRRAIRPAPGDLDARERGRARGAPGTSPVPRQRTAAPAGSGRVARQAIPRRPPRAGAAA